MKFSITANSPLEEIPAHAQFVRGLFVFYHKGTSSTLIVLPANHERKYPVVYTWKQPNIFRSSPMEWKKTNIANNIQNIDDAIKFVSDDIVQSLPHLYVGCSACGT